MPEPGGWYVRPRKEAVQQTGYQDVFWYKLLTCGISEWYCMELLKLWSYVTLLCVSSWMGDHPSYGLVTCVSPWISFLDMMQASLATCCWFATGLHILKSGISALFEMHAETVQKWTHKIQWETLVSLHSYYYHYFWRVPRWRHAFRIPSKYCIVKISLLGRLLFIYWLIQFLLITCDGNGLSWSNLA